MEKVPLPSDSKWTIYGSTSCSFCKKALRFFRVYNIPYVYYDVNKFGCAATKEQLKHLTNNHKTIPIIFKGTKFIGGYSDLCSWATQ